MEPEYPRYLRYNGEITFVSEDGEQWIVSYTQYPVLIYSYRIRDAITAGESTIPTGTSTMEVFRALLDGIQDPEQLTGPVEEWVTEFPIIKYLEFIPDFKRLQAQDDNPVLRERITRTHFVILREEYGIHRTFYKFLTSYRRVVIYHPKISTVNLAKFSLYYRLVLPPVVTTIKELRKLTDEPSTLVILTYVPPLNFASPISIRYASAFLDWFRSIQQIDVVYYCRGDLAYRAYLLPSILQRSMDTLDDFSKIMDYTLDDPNEREYAREVIEQDPNGPIALSIAWKGISPYYEGTI